MTEHEDIARRLREQAQASAPADLLPAVMAEVRAEPRQSHQRRRWPAWPRWQPVAAWTAAAATLVALGVGIAHLPGTSSSSSGSESTAAGGASAAAPVAHGTRLDLQAQVFTVPRAAARRILGPLLGTAGAPQGPAASGVTVRVPPARYDYYALKLRQAQLNGTAAKSSSSPSPTVIIKLLRAHRR